jgi:hypothetical protein
MKRSAISSNRIFGQKTEYLFLVLTRGIIFSTIEFSIRFCVRVVMGRFSTAGVALGTQQFVKRREKYSDGQTARHNSAPIDFQEV